MINSLMKKMKKNKKGFTLIELIVVIAILGILAAIAIPRFDAVMTNSKAKADTAALDVVAKAATLYYINTNQSYGVTEPTNLVHTLKINGYIDNNPVSVDGTEVNTIIRPSTGAAATVTLTSDAHGNHTASW